MEVNPLSIILVKSDSKGDRLLFRYPYSSDPKPVNSQKFSKKNPYALTVNEDLLQSPPPLTSNISKGNLTGLTDEVLSNLFAVKPELYERKFELKVNDVRFVGHPTLFQSGIIDRNVPSAHGLKISSIQNVLTVMKNLPLMTDGACLCILCMLDITSAQKERINSDCRVNNNFNTYNKNERTTGSIPTSNLMSINHSDLPSAILINTVFALHSYASHSIVKCYYDLSKRIGAALKHEEKRCCYVTSQTKEMIAAHDEIAQKIAEMTDGHFESPFELILHRSSLAKDLKKVFDDLSTTGLVHIRINRWIEVSFCLPHKVHQIPFTKKGFVMEPEIIDKCLESIRPYHGLLLLVEPLELLDSSPPDSSPALLRLIQVYSPLKSFQTLAADADITMAHVFQLTGHMVYWAQAMVIYPLCENNVYVIAPDAPTQSTSPLVEKFSEKFPGENLLQMMSEFSLPTSLSQKLSPLIPQPQQRQLVQMIAWMLQHRLLLQLHTYVHLMPSLEGHPMAANKKKSARNTSKTIRSRTQSGSETSEDYLKFYGAKTDIPTFKSVTDAFVMAHEDDKTSAVQKLLLEHFSQEEREAILRIPASSNPEDLYLIISLYDKGYLSGKHHLEEIMYSINVKRSQLLQILDKFRDILITCEIEDPAISIFYSHYKSDFRD